MLQQKFRSGIDDADHEELHTTLPRLIAMDELLERCEPDASSATLTQGISCLPPSTARSLCHHIYTSGSTGAPKAVSVSHLAMRAYAQEKVRVHGIEPSSRVLVTSAHTWDPCIGDVLSTLAAGEWSRTHLHSHALRPWHSPMALACHTLVYSHPV
jgi:acyl-coenzyme A synthetase/AMP-(fatty) acid ligase